MLRAAIAALLLTSGAYAGCKSDDAPCEVPSGTYHLTVPNSAERTPALIFLHGAGGSGKGAIRMKTASNRGYALIGPNGLKRPNSRFGPGWSFHPDRPKQRNEAEFLREIIADAVANHNVDPARILIAGFSIGGSMTSYLACDDPSLAKAFAPVAGGFWRPHPDMGSCEGPVNLFHTHGWRDKTVPLEGRPLGGGRIYQGDIFVTLQIWREENGCENMRADTFDTDGPFWRRKWDTCASGALEFALHQGGHGIPKGWSDMVLDWFEALPE
jgi:polyhydroxybutyrate depolymerase